LGGGQAITAQPHDGPGDAAHRARAGDVVRRRARRARWSRRGVGVAVMRRRLTLASLTAAAWLATPVLAHAQNNASVNIEGVGSISAPLQIVLLLTLLSFLPAILMTMTSFTRIVIVFHFLRQALGTQEAPSNQILIGL